MLRPRPGACIPGRMFIRAGWGEREYRSRRSDAASRGDSRSSMVAVSHEASPFPDDGPRGRPHSVSSYFGAFAPAPEWDELVWWPPDVFTLANLVLDHTEAYRFVVAPPPGRRWPPLPHWSERVRAAARL